MSDNVSFRSATAADAAELTDIAFRSKAYWGYSEEFMEACREELTLTRHDLRAMPALSLTAKTDHRPGIAAMAREARVSVDFVGQGARETTKGNRLLMD